MFVHSILCGHSPRTRYCFIVVIQTRTIGWASWRYLSREHTVSRTMRTRRFQLIIIVLHYRGLVFFIIHFLNPGERRRDPICLFALPPSSQCALMPRAMSRVGRVCRVSRCTTALDYSYYNTIGVKSGRTRNAWDVYSFPNIICEVAFVGNIYIYVICIQAVKRRRNW